jgi:hypothetical protein
VAIAGTSLTVSARDVATDPLLQAESQLLGDVVTVKAQAAAGTTLVLSSSLWVRLRMTLSDGQRDDRTFWLVVRKR